MMEEGGSTDRSDNPGGPLRREHSVDSDLALVGRGLEENGVRC